MKHSTRTRIDWDTVKSRLLTSQQMHLHSSSDDLAMRKIFEKRAERLAAIDTRGQAEATTSGVLVFRLDKESYGVDLRYIARVFPNVRITAVPGAQENLLGIANLQGEVRSIFSLRRLLMLADNDIEVNRYILLLRQRERRIGLQVEHIEGIRQFSLDDLREHEFASTDKRSQYVSGVTADKVIVLRADRLFEN